MAAGMVALGCDNEVDLVNVQPWLVKEAAEIELPRRDRAATAPVREWLDAASVRWRLQVVLGDAAPEITRIADALGSGAIAIGSHGADRHPTMVAGRSGLQGLAPSQTARADSALMSARAAGPR